MKAKEKLAYLKGLAEGFGLMEKKEEKKLFNLAYEVIEDLIEDVEDLSARLDFQEYVSDDMSEALMDLEDAFYEDENDYDDDYDLEDYDDCDCCGDVYDISCPNCGGEFSVDGGVVEQGAINCPLCGERLEIEGVVDEDEEGCGCGCGCGGEEHSHSHSYPVDYEHIFAGGCSPSACSSCGGGCGGYEIDDDYEDEEEED